MTLIALELYVRTVHVLEFVSLTKFISSKSFVQEQFFPLEQLVSEQNERKENEDKIFLIRSSIYLLLEFSRVLEPVCQWMSNPIGSKTSSIFFLRRVCNCNNTWLHRTAFALSTNSESLGKICSRTVLEHFRESVFYTGHFFAISPLFLPETFQWEVKVSRSELAQNSFQNLFCSLRRMWRVDKGGMTTQLRTRDTYTWFAWGT